MDRLFNRPIGDLIELRHYNLWQLLKLYWQSLEKTSAYLYSILILSLALGIVVINILINYWYNNFYNALQAYNMNETIRLFGIFIFLAAIYISFVVYQYYISQIFAIRWRRWLTKQFIGRWLRNRGYYYLENFDEKTDNPDQRIQEDIKSIVVNTIDLVSGLFTSVITLVGFMIILWKLSSVLSIPLGRYGFIKIPGYLVWVSLIYSLLGTLITFWIGKPLVPLNFEQQKREANFRHAAIDLRTHSEDIALYRAEDYERGFLYFLFRGVLDNWYLIARRQKKLLWFTASFAQIGIFLPLAAALPNYFTKAFLLGGLMQTVNAFRQVQDSLSYLITSFNQIAEWRATGLRLTTFINHLDDIEEKAEKADHLTFNREDSKEIAVNNVTIRTPRDEILLKAIDKRFQHGTNYLIRGKSGLGKSTFLRTIAGIWPFADGEISIPTQQKMMYIPQTPYMPIGTLANAIAFPKNIENESKENIKDIMKKCNLEKFIPRLDEYGSWSEQLSPGEQQRVAFARVLLLKPDWVFLDESTSMLDLNNEKFLYETLQKEVPHCSIISVGHRPSLEGYHDETIEMQQFAAHS